MDDLNDIPEETVTAPGPAQEPGADAGGGGGALFAESSVTDFGPVVELLEQQNDLLVTQHDDLLQVQANLDFVFLAVCMLAGVVIGCAISRVLHDLWRA